MIPKDKLIVDCSGDENKALADKLSRAEPGDSIEFGKVTATLDEYQNNIAVFSLDEIEVKGGGAEMESGTASDPAEESADGEAPAASVALFKTNGKKK